MAIDQGNRMSIILYHAKGGGVVVDVCYNM